MPEISKRGLKIPESPIRKLVPFAEAAKRKGRIIYHLNIGQPDIETPQCARDAIRNDETKVIAYSHSAGNESYRRKLCEYYKKFDINIDIDEILVTTGGSEAIIFSFLSCLNPGDEIIIPEPFYANYNGFAVTAGVDIKPVTSSIEDGFALPPISELENLIGPKTRGILINNPNNPTGYLYSRDELHALRDIIKKHDLYLFSDEVYKEFVYDGLEFVSTMHLEGIEDNVVMIDSVSKRYSACGVRIGAMASKNKDIIMTALKFAQARLSPPGYGQIAAEAAVDTPDDYFGTVMKEYVARRNLVVESLNKIDGIICPNPKGAFYAAVRLPVDNADRYCQWLLEEFEHENQTVMLAPMTGFYSTPGLGQDEVRIGYVLNVEALKNSLKCIEESLKVYPGRK